MVCGTVPLLIILFALQCVLLLLALFSVLSSPPASDSHLIALVDVALVGSVTVLLFGVIVHCKRWSQ
jgi:hypothetical protein